MELSPDADIELIESSGGVFEISRDGQLLFSKKKLGRFPYDKEIDALVK
jgi:selenoprotein W-related protein